MNKPIIPILQKRPTSKQIGMTEFPISRYCWSHISYVASNYPMKNRLRLTATPYMQRAAIDILRSNSAEPSKTTIRVLLPHRVIPLPKKPRQTHQQINFQSKEIYAPMDAQRLRFLKSVPQRPPTLHKDLHNANSYQKEALKPLDRCKDLRLLEIQQ